MRTALALGLAVLAFLVAGLLADAPTGDRIVAGVTVAHVPVGGLTPAQARARLAAAFPPAKPIIVRAGGRQRSTTLGRLGFEPDIRRASYAAFLVDRRPDLASRVAALFGGDPRELPISVAYDPYRFETFAERLSDGGRLRAERAEGGWRWTAPAIAPLDRVAALAILRRSVASGARTVEIPTAQTSPSLAGFVLRGWIEQDFHGKTPASLVNLAHAATILSGAYVPANGEFNFDRQVGARDAAHGFVLGRGIRGGQIVDDDEGGGACGSSTTFFRLALLTGAEILERHPHSERPSLPGLDATISGHRLNLRFRYPVPVLFATSMDGARLRVEVYSAQPLALCRVDRARIASARGEAWLTTRSFPDGRPAEEFRSRYRLVRR